MFYFYLFNVLYFLHHRLSVLGGILFKNLHWGYICPGLDFLSYLFHHGAKFFRGERRGIEPGLLRLQFSNLSVRLQCEYFFGITLLVGIR